MARKWSKHKVREMRVTIHKLRSFVEDYYQGQKKTIREMVKIMEENCAHKSVSFECDPSGNNDNSWSCNDCGKEF